MERASSRSPKKIFPQPSFSRSPASSSLCVRTATAYRRVQGARATSTIARTSTVSAVAMTSMRASAICAWISTPASVASPDTAGTPRCAGGPRTRGSLPRRRKECLRAQSVRDALAHPAPPTRTTCSERYFRSVDPGSFATDSSRRSTRRASRWLGYPGLEWLDGAEDEGIEQSRSSAGHDQALAFLGNSPSDMPSPPRMKENSPICARLAETVRAVFTDSGRAARSTRRQATCPGR